MRKQVRDGDIAYPRIFQLPLQLKHFDDLVVQSHVPLVDQIQHSDCRYRFSGTRKAKAGVMAKRLLPPKAIFPTGFTVMLLTTGHDYRQLTGGGSHITSGIPLDLRHPLRRAFLATGLPLDDKGFAVIQDARWPERVSDHEMGNACDQQDQENGDKQVFNSGRLHECIEVPDSNRESFESADYIQY